ncbi:MAG: hypothetical protein ACRD6X_00250 [Pyrinomonadaceae bacterium]
MHNPARSKGGTTGTQASLPASSAERGVRTGMSAFHCISPHVSKGDTRISVQTGDLIPPLFTRGLLQWRAFTIAVNGTSDRCKKPPNRELTRA